MRFHLTRESLKRSDKWRYCCWKLKLLRSRTTRDAFSRCLLQIFKKFAIIFTSTSIVMFMQLASSSKNWHLIVDVLMKSMNKYAKTEDYAIHKSRSKKNIDRVINKIWIVCDKKDKLEYKDQEHRSIFSRVIDCRFECIVKLNDDEKNWSVNENRENWFLTIKNFAHNHLFDLFDVHSIHRKTTMTTNVKKKIAKKIRKEFKIFFILIDIRLNENEENSLFKSRDVYNVKAYLRNEELSSLTSTQTLMKTLSDNDKWFSKIEIDEIKRFQYLFFTSHCMQKLLIENFEIFIMNCIYKTNRYKIFFFIIVDVISLNNSFFVDFCFMKDENFNDYVWALETM